MKRGFISKSILALFAVLLLFALPQIATAQPAPPGNGGGEETQPEEPADDGGEDEEAETPPTRDEIIDEFVANAHENGSEIDFPVLNLELREAGYDQTTEAENTEIEGDLRRRVLYSNAVDAFEAGRDADYEELDRILGEHGLEGVNAGDIETVGNLLDGFESGDLDAFTRIDLSENSQDVIEALLNGDDLSEEEVAGILSEYVSDLSDDQILAVHEALNGGDVDPEALAAAINSIPEISGVRADDIELIDRIRNWDDLDNGERLDVVRDTTCRLFALFCRGDDDDDGGTGRGRATSQIQRGEEHTRVQYTQRRTHPNLEVEGTIADTDRDRPPPGTQGGNTATGGTGASTQARQSAELQARGQPLEEAYDGWSHMYDSSCTSIICRLSDRGEPVRHPVLSRNPNAPAGNLYTMRLGVDHEILKRQMPIFHHAGRMKNSFLASEWERDQFLAAYDTVRAVTILTLNYLDKTVAAGLHVVEDQTAQNSQMHLLKQISQSTWRLANPQWGHVVEDNEEKIVQCMYEAEAGNVSDDRYVLSVGTALGSCAEHCGAPPEEAAGRFDFCVCCADWMIEPNPAGTYSPGDGDLVTGFSLVDRFFFGSDGSGPDAAYKIVDDALTFRNTYGDIEIRLERAGSGVGAVETDRIVQEFIPPATSVPEAISKLRNGAGGDQAMADSICGSLLRLLRNWDVRSDDALEQRRADFGVFARSGITLTARDIESALSLDDTARPIEPSEDFPLETTKLHRWTQNACDAGAVAFFAKIHFQMSAYFLDHYILNQAMSDDHKIRMQQLIQRVDTLLVLTAQDLATDAHARAQVTGILIHNDRVRAAELGSQASTLGTAIGQYEQGRNIGLGFGMFQRFNN